MLFVISRVKATNDWVPGAADAIDWSKLSAEVAALQGIVEQYKGSAILEVQARSCEYSHMFKLDGMRAALLEHIPPLDESTYTRNLGNSQVIDAAGAAQVSCWSREMLTLQNLLICKASTPAVS